MSGFNTAQTKKVTFVLTSCGRIDLLKRTMSSFLKFNTYPIEKYFIIEDSGNSHVLEELNDEFGSFCSILFNNPKLGHLGSVDKVYSLVNSEYIFHCEDDWEFYRPGFIEDILTVLGSDPKVKHVGIRSIHHEMLIHHERILYEEWPINIGGIKCYKAYMANIEEEDLTGFSFNPTVVRLSDYKLAQKYSFLKNENGISEFYKEKGFYTVYLENDAVKHIGWDRSTIIEREERARKHRRSIRVRLSNLVKSLLNLIGFDLKLVS
ncbi:hypothetical protein [uncultured Pontibacter sp.]|uniref:hypothetical protein n=1 Tax=uncultured Pontibacter sp. TaxID=453356 RepID=UPI00260EC9B2|nr:hypothetical protein [uncultured Pontibacter sp.]